LMVSLPEYNFKKFGQSDDLSLALKGAV